MTTIVKIGGSVLDPAPSPALADAVAGRYLAGERLCLVHGGGKALTATLERLRIPSRFEGGLRVTDEETLAAAAMVLAGLVNKRLVAALNRALLGQGERAAAVGLSGVDGGSVLAAPLRPALGFVGEVVAPPADAPAGPFLVAELLDLGWLPVLASLASRAQPPAKPGAQPPAESETAMLNVNADAFAAGCAAQLRADRLVFLTDVPGVLDASGATIPRLDLDQMEALRQSGAAAGGMLPKLAACRAALAAGVGRVEIIGVQAFLGEAPDDARNLGTRILAPAAAAGGPAARPAGGAQ